MHSSLAIIPIILCGGSGSRLWPLSREHYPKQFLTLVGETSLFQQSVCRAVDLENKDIQIDQIIIVTNENHRFLVLEQLDELSLKVPTRILLEPESKNTAPALTLAALAAKEKNPESVLVVMPADHYIKDLRKFNKTMNTAILSAENHAIVTLGIKPCRPDTGFGYIHFDGKEVVKKVLSFKEKPNLLMAKKLVSQDRYCWNCGVFILKPNTWLNATEQSNPKMSELVKKSWRYKEDDKWFERPNEKFFRKSPSDSIDYVVMEKCEDLGLQVKLVLLDAGWSDLGSFNALEGVENKDRDGNIFNGVVVSLNTKNTMAISSDKNVSLLGVDNLIVIQTQDAVLVANKNQAQSIKSLVKILEKKHQSLIKESYRVSRPWGWYQTIDLGQSYKVKLIYVKPGGKLSYQSHNYRNEHWVVLEGKATVICNAKKFILNHDESTYIKVGSKHQLINEEKKFLKIIEVQTGTKLIEEDIERYDDVYGRL